MSALVILDVDEATLARLREQAMTHGRTPEMEAKAILTAALQTPPADPWAAAEAIHQRLAATGQVFSDSAELLREDRDR
jgi:plasmid stability protein